MTKPRTFLYRISLVLLLQLFGCGRSNVEIRPVVTYDGQAVDANAKVRVKRLTDVVSRASSETFVLTTIVFENDGAEPADSIVIIDNLVGLDCIGRLQFVFRKSGELGDIFTDWAWAGKGVDEIGMKIEYAESTGDSKPNKWDKNKWATVYSEYKPLIRNTPVEKIHSLRWTFPNVSLAAHDGADDPSRFDVSVDTAAYRPKIKSDAGYVRHFLRKY